MQRNANMLKFLKKCVFADFMGFFVKIQSPVCPPNKLLSFRRIYKTLNTNWLNLPFYILCGKIKTLHRKMIVLHRQITFRIFAEGTKYRILEINIDTP